MRVWSEYTVSSSGQGPVARFVRYCNEYQDCIKDMKYLTPVA